jgi:hypothetical protein
MCWPTERARIELEGKRCRQMLKLLSMKRKTSSIIKQSLRMKKLTPTGRRWFAVRQRSVLRRSSRHKQLKQAPRGCKVAWKPVSIYRPSQSPYMGRGLAMPMPTVLCFDNNPAETLKSLGHIRSTLHENRMLRLKLKADPIRRPRVKYSAFEQIREISPSAALVLASEFERAYHHNGFEAIMVNLEQWHPTVMGMLRALGFFEKFGFSGAMPEPDVADQVRILPMRSGSSADSVAVDTLIRDLKSLYPLADEGRKKGLIHLYGAMVEAIVNVVRHAYPVGAEHQFPPIDRWWMAGAVDHNARSTTAMVFDQGITIPVSLPNWERYAGVTRRLASLLGLVPAASDTKSDGLAISAAVEESVSSTGDSHRGRGLAQMRDFVDHCRGGYLRIMSRCGEVVMQPGTKPVVRSYETSIGGTLIEWNVRI